MPRAVGRGARPLHRLLAEIRGMAAKRPLVDRAVFIPVEGHAEMFEFVDDLGRHLAHVLDRVLVPKVIGAFDGVEHVPVPVVFAHVAKRCADTALSGNRVRPGREDLRENRDVVTRFCKLQRAAHTGTAGTYNHRIEAAPRQAIGQMIDDFCHVRLSRE